MSDNDVDAQFADIVAHWDDVTPEPERAVTHRAAAPVDSADEPDDANAVGDAPAALLEPGDEAEPEVEGEPAGEPPEAPEAPEATTEAGRTTGATGLGSDGMLTGIPVWRGAQATPEQVWEADEEEHFEPGPTAPLPPQEDVQFWGIIVGLVGGPLLLLWLVLFRPSVSHWWTLLALGLSIGGFVLLVMRQPHSRDENDPDDGAVV